jgi:hypothetical protein
MVSTLGITSKNASRVSFKNATEEAKAPRPGSKKPQSGRIRPSSAAIKPATKKGPSQKPNNDIKAVI